MSGHVCRQQLTSTRKRPHVCTPEPVGCSCLFAQAAADPEKLAMALPEASTQLIQFVNNFDTPHVYVLVCFDIRKHTRVQ